MFSVTQYLGRIARLAQYVPILHQLYANPFPALQRVQPIPLISSLISSLCRKTKSMSTNSKFNKRLQSLPVITYGHRTLLKDIVGKESKNQF